MIVRKLTTGTVVQEFDTDRDTWISQEFVAGPAIGWCEWEAEDGDVGSDEFLRSLEHIIDSPCLSFNMIQP